tara:strand:+ start:478 stop:654 length:177 start_codon:yes stop_codon:yes gene_type:complete
MAKLFNIFNRFYDFSRNQNLYVDKDLIKYFKSEFGNEWKIELEKHLIRTESDNINKAS